MGSWYETCVISHLPIETGTPTRLVLLVQSPDFTDGAHAGHTGGHSLWTPVCVPILGTYDGYGRVTIPPGWHADLILRRILDDGVENPRQLEGVTPVYTKDLAGTEAMTHVQDLVRHGRLAMRATVAREEELPVGLCFIRDDVYQALVDAPIYTETAVLTASDRATKTLQSLQETKTSPLHTGQITDMMAMFDGTEFGVSLKEAMVNLVDYRRHAEAFGSYGPPGYRGVGAYRLQIAERIMSGVDPEHPEIVAAATEYGTFLHVLLHFENLRLLWGPMSGAGSQQTHWESHVTLARIMNTVAMAEFARETGKYEDPPKS